MRVTRRRKQKEGEEEKEVERRREGRKCRERLLGDDADSRSADADGMLCHGPGIENRELGRRVEGLHWWLETSRIFIDVWEGREGKGSCVMGWK